MTNNKSIFKVLLIVVTLLLTIVSFFLSFGILVYGLKEKDNSLAYFWVPFIIFILLGIAGVI